MGRSDLLDNGKNLQDKRRKNWFWDSNEIFASDLSSFAKLVRLYLARCANSDRQSFPSYNRIAKDCGVSRDTAKRAIAELEKKGWVKKTIQKKDDGEHLSNIYYLCDPPEVKKEENKNERIKTKGGRRSQHPPCHNLEGVGAHSTQVGAHSTGVGAEAAPNNTNRTILSEQEIYKQSVNHSITHHDNDDDRAREKTAEVKAVDIVDYVDNVDFAGTLAGGEGSAKTQAVRAVLEKAGFKGLPVEMEYLARWINVFPPEMIEYAVSKAVLNGIKSLPYVAGIFEDWLIKGVKTIEQALKETRYDSVLKQVGRGNKQGPEHCQKTAGYLDRRQSGRPIC